MIRGLVWTVIEPGDGSAPGGDVGLLRGGVLLGGPTPPIGARIVLVRCSYPPDPAWPGGGPWDTIRGVNVGGCAPKWHDAPASWGGSPPTPVDWLVGSGTQILVGISDPTGDGATLDAPGGIAANRRLHLGWIPPIGD